MFETAALKFNLFAVLIEFPGFFFYAFCLFFHFFALFDDDLKNEIFNSITTYNSQVEKLYVKCTIFLYFNVYFDVFKIDQKNSTKCNL